MKLRPVFRNTATSSSVLQPIKLRAIDAAFQRGRVSSFADLGGVWVVEAGYTFYVLETYRPSRAVLVDEEPTSEVVRRATDFPALTLLSRNFGAEQTPAELGHVDAILLFDVLLHQVDPDWDGILRMYAPVTDCFVIANPQFVAGPTTTRLLELGRDRYLELVPPQPNYSDLFDRLDEYLPDRGRRYRDIHNIWQWGIVDTDLIATMKDQGFELVYFENAGQWQAQPAFEHHAFVFQRASLGPGSLDVPER